MEFRPLASSSAGCAYLVKGEGAPLLIECGVRLQELQRATGFQVTSLAGCLVSHSHGDHCSGVGALTALGVDCYGSRETWDALGTSTQSQHRLHLLEPNVQRSVGGYEVVPFPVVHDAPGTLGFLVAQGREKLLYLTDTMYSPFRFEGVTVAAIEANWSEEAMRRNHREGLVHSKRFSRTARNHMSIDTAVRLLKACDLSRLREVWLLHLSDANSDEEEFVDKVRRAVGKPVYVAPARTGAAARTTIAADVAPVGDLDETLGQGRR